MPGPAPVGTAVAVATRPTERPGRLPDLRHLDGLRALAALAVVVLHAYNLTGHRGDAARDLAPIRSLVQDGNYAVAVFITLSGFVLMVPVARTADLRIPRGTAAFLRRRARRILPPYFAAYGLALLLVLAVPALRRAQGTSFADQVPVTVGGVLSHLLLVHNVSAGWATQTDGPLWSVATEWQIYLLMPLVLLPVWRRLGPAPGIALALAAGALVHLLLPRVDAAHYWFVGEFSLGMLAALAVVRAPRLRLLPTVATVAALVTLGLYVFDRDPIAANTPASELGVGVVCALGLWALAQQAADTDAGAPAGIVLRTLRSRPLQALGLFSYSIYLVHQPLLALGDVLLLPVALPTAVRFALMILVVAPLAVGVAFVFHLLVERRFLTSHQRALEPVR